MCGRARVTPSAEDLRELFAAFEGQLELRADLTTPRYNIAPSQPIPVIRPVEGHLRLEELRWSLPGDKRPVALVRAESLERGAFRSRGRCLVVVSGFYEWRGAKGSKRQPFEAHRAGGGMLTLAGIVEGDACAIVTQPSAGPLADVHDRMPLVVPPALHRPWLGAGPTSQLVTAVRGDQEIAEHLEVRAVSTWVNSTRHDGPRCLEPPERDLFT